MTFSTSNFDSVTPLQSGAFFIPAFALIVESSRIGFAWAYLKVEPALLRLLRRDDPMVLNDLGASLAAGAGFALMSAVVTHGRMVGESWRQEVRYSEHCDQMSLSSLAAGQAALGFPLHLALSVLAFDGVRRIWGMGSGGAPQGDTFSGWVRIAGVFTLHLGTSLVSLLNSAGGGACIASLPIQAVVVIGSVCAAAWVVS